METNMYVDTDKMKAIATIVGAVDCNADAILNALKGRSYIEKQLTIALVHAVDSAGGNLAKLKKLLGELNDVIENIVEGNK